MMSIRSMFRVWAAASPSPPPQTAAGTVRKIYVLLAAVLGLGLLVQAMPGLQKALEAPPLDLGVDLLTSRAYLDGYSPYTPEGAVRSGAAAVGTTGNGHPPTTSFWTLPLARMSDATAGFTVAWICILALLVQLAATMTLLHFPAPFASAWVGLAYILGTSFMAYHFRLGQISAPIGFLYFAAWAAGRRGEDWMAGAMLGAACTLKLFPGVMVLFFLLAFRWRAVLAAAGVYVAVAAIMTARFGLSSWPLFMAKQGPVADQYMASLSNQSIHGVILRLFWPACGPVGPVLPAATLISSALSVLMLAGAAWLVRRIVSRGGFDVAYAMFAVLSVVTSQWTWEHYTVIYALPVLILAAYLVKRWRAQEFRPAVLGLGAGLIALVASWQISMYTKYNFQTSVRQGHLENHLRLHLYEVLNWAPGVVLLVMLAVACGWERKRVLRVGTGQPQS